MKSKTSSFSSTLFFSTIKRFSPIFICYLVIWMMVLVFPLGSTLSLLAETQSESMASSAAYDIISTANSGGLLISAIFGLLFAMAAFSYLYNSRSVSMVCSLPMKRESVFLSVTAPGLAGMIVSNIIVFGAAYAVQCFHGLTDFTYILQGFSIVCLLNLFFFGFAILCASFTGHILVLPVIYFLLNITAYAVIVFVSAILTNIVYGFGNVNLVYETGIMFTPLIYLSLHGSVLQNLTEAPYAQYTNWTYIIILAVIGIVFTILSLMLIKKRRMETAGDVVSVRPLKPVFKYFLSVGCALVVGFGIFAIIFRMSLLSGIYMALALLPCLIVGAFIGYFAAEMLIQKTLKVFRGKVWVGFIITALALSSLTFAMEFDLTGYEKKVPAIEQIEMIDYRGVVSGGTLTETADFETFAKIHESIISDKDYNEALYSSEPNFQHFSFTYTLKDGTQISRIYRMPVLVDDVVSETGKMIEALANQPNMIMQRYEPSFEISRDTGVSGHLSLNSFEVEAEQYVYYEGSKATQDIVVPEESDPVIALTAEECYELYFDCIVPDMEDGTIGNDWMNMNSDEYFSSHYNVDINISFTENLSDGVTSYISVQPTIHSERTVKWLEDYGIELSTLEH